VRANNQRTTQLAVAALLLAGTLFGLMWLPLKYFAAQGISGLVLSLITYGAVGLLGLPILLSQIKQWSGQWLLLIAGGFFGGATNVAFVYAMMNGSVMRVMLLFYLAPVWSVLGARFFFHEVLTPLRLAAVAMALCGAVLVLGGPGIFSEPLSVIDLVALASGVFCAGQNLSSRAAEEVPIISKTVAILFGCGLLSGLLLPLTVQAVPTITFTQFLQLVGFGIFWLLTALWVTMYGVTHLEASRSAVLLVVELAVAVVSALVIGGERLSVTGWVGAALIAAAALIESRVARSQNLAEESASTT
jgi:drug/metabolite transporter (DMT)-like permease